MAQKKVMTNRNPKPRVPGKVEMGQRGWGVRLWHDADPLITNLVSKGEAFKLLYALRYGWSSVTLQWVGGHTRRVNLQPYWHRRTHPSPPQVTRTVAKPPGVTALRSFTSDTVLKQSSGSSSTVRAPIAGRQVKPWRSWKGLDTSRSG